MYDTYIKNVREHISEPALYEQLAEECCELGQAALKKSRKMRNENYTPKTMEEIDAALEEELTDVYLACKTLGLSVNNNVYKNKIIRWRHRNQLDCGDQ